MWLGYQAGKGFSDITLIKKGETSVLKTCGLNMEVYKRCKEILNNIPQRSHVRIGFILWMETQLMVADSVGMGNIGLPISSDNIESLFGLGKTHGTGDLKSPKFS